VAVDEQLDDSKGVSDVPVRVLVGTESVQVLEKLAVTDTEGGLGERLCGLTVGVPVPLVEKLETERLGVAVLLRECVPDCVLLGTSVAVPEGVGEPVGVLVPLQLGLVLAVRL